MFLPYCGIHSQLMSHSFFLKWHTLRDPAMKFCNLTFFHIPNKPQNFKTLQKDKLVR